MRPDAKLLRIRKESATRSSRQRTKYRSRISAREMRSLTAIDQELAPGFYRVTGDEQFDSIKVIDNSIRTR